MFAYNSSYEGLLERQRDPLNSVNNAAFGFSSTNMVGAMDGMEKVHDESTHNSGSGDSNSSNLSALENETDDFGRLLLQHQRDAKRLSNAVRGGKEQAFRKARPKPGVAERLEREERERLANGQNHERISNGGSPARNEVEPPVTVPREWGRRARKQTDWLKKIVGPSEDGIQEHVNGDAEAVYERNTAFTGDLDWQDVTEKPVQSIEHTPPSIRRHQTLDTPSSLNHMNTTLKPTYNFEEQDFTSDSLFASTPAPTRYHRKIDELARQELEELEIKAVTTRTLDQIDLRSPNAVLRSRSNSKLRERASADRLRSPIMSPEKIKSPSRIPVRRQHLSYNKENAPPNGYSTTTQRSTEAPEQVNVENEEQATKVEKNGIDKRPLHARNDSMNLLKKLARVSSLSPSPARPRSEFVVMKDEGDAERGIDDAGAVPAVNDGTAKNAPEPPVDLETRPHHDDADVRSGDPNLHHRTNNPMRWKPGQAAFVENNIPTAAAERQDAAEEAVTPLDEDGQPLEMTKSLEDQVQIDAIVEGLAKVKPEYPRSALEAIVREAKAEREAQQFGESTIQSLEDIVHPDLDPTITFDIDTMNADREEENLDDGRPLTQAEKDRRQEDLAMEAMNKHLRTARTSIKDANRGLRRVENRIDTAEEHPLLAPATRNVQSKAVVIAPSIEPNNLYCPTCGCTQRSVWKALYLEFRSLFYTYDESSRPIHKYVRIPIRLRFTRLGWYIFLWLTWYIVECTMCSIYCRPEYAYSMVGYGIWPDAPEFPFVIPTMAIRPFKPLWKPVVELIEMYYHAIFGNPEEIWQYDNYIRGANGMPTRVSPAESKAAWSSSYTATHIPSFLTSVANWAKETPSLAPSLSSRITRAGWHTFPAWSTLTGHVARATHSFVDAVDQAEGMWNDEVLT